MFYLIPIRDEYGVKRFPIVVTSIIVINSLIFFIFGFRGDYHQIVLKFGFIPKNFLFKTLITSMFLHSGLFHLGGNMWYLWLFGDNIEDRWGRFNFLIFYLLSGIFASILYCVLIPEKFKNIPTIGASGAISGVLGSYAVLFPKSKITFLYGTLRRRGEEIEIYSYIWLFLWFFMQTLNTLLTFLQIIQSQVAYAAHFAGFLFGAIIGIGSKLYKEAKYRENVKLGENMLLQILGEGEKKYYTEEQIKEIENLKKKIIDVIYEDRILATKFYIDGVKNYPDLCLPPKIQIEIANSLDGQGEKEYALIAYKNFILKYPLSKLADNALLEFGKICFEKGDYEKAKQAFLQIVIFYPYSDVYEEAKYYLEKELPQKFISKL